MDNASAGMRIDKWLWCARFFKTRADAARCVSGGRMRLDGDPMSKPHRQVRPGHVLTFAKGDDIRVIKIISLAIRRGPASEAQELYEDLAPPEPRRRNAEGASRPFEDRPSGSGRPTKRERRLTDKLKR